jgi:hypothetical protein
LRVYDYAEYQPAVIDRLGQDDGHRGAHRGMVVAFTQAAEAHDSADRQDAVASSTSGCRTEGFDDGLAIFNLREDLCHGQVQLYAAPGFEATYLTNGERQSIFEAEMLPALRRCDFDAALTAAMTRIEGATTAERASSLQLARQVDAVTGLIVAPLLLIGLVAWAGWSWLRFGRDPIYLDDASILMPAPPPGLTPAAAAAVLDGGGHA